MKIKKKKKKIQHNIILECPYIPPDPKPHEICEQFPAGSGLMLSLWIGSLQRAKLKIHPFKNIFSNEVKVTFAGRE